MSNDVYITVIERCPTSYEEIEKTWTLSALRDVFNSESLVFKLTDEIESLRAEVERLEKALNGAVKKITRYELAGAARNSRDASITGGGR